MSMFDPYDSLVPVFLETKIPKRTIQIGTAIFREIWGQPFLFTVAHITDELRNGKLLVPTELGLSPVEGYIAHTDILPEASRRGDSVDIAYCRLTKEFAARLSFQFVPLPSERTQLIRSAHELNICSASGYPASKAKKQDGSYYSEIFSFRGVVAKQEIYEELNYSPEQTIIIHFHKKRAIDPKTRNAFPTPSLKGMSGGGIFAWPRGSEVSSDWTLPSLVGIIHSYKEREGLIIGTALLPMMAALSLGRMKGFGDVQ